MKTLINALSHFAIENSLICNENFIDFKLIKYNVNVKIEIIDENINIKIDLNDELKEYFIKINGSIKNYIECEFNFDFTEVDDLIYEFEKLTDISLEN